MRKCFVESVHSCVLPHPFQYILRVCLFNTQVVHCTVVVTVTILYTTRAVRLSMAIYWWQNIGRAVPDDTILDVDVGVEDAVLVDDAAAFDEQSVLGALQTKTRV